MSANAERMTDSAGPTAAAAPAPRAAIVCRQIQDADIPGIVDLLDRGFPERPRAYWEAALERLRTRAVIDDLPRFGFALFEGPRAVGVLLLIVSRDDSGATRGNLSCWYVEERYRGLSSLLQARALKLKNVTLFNISPAPGTIATITAAGFTPYATGAFIALAGVGGRHSDARVEGLDPESLGGDARLERLASMGCHIYATTGESGRQTFAFLPRRRLRGFAPCAYLVHAPSVEAFVEVARPLGRQLLASGLPFVAIDACGPIKGLIGLFREGQPKMVRGPHPPRLGDLSETELTWLGP